MIGNTGKRMELQGKILVNEMHYDSHGSKGPGVYCTCGAHKIHHRGKVLAKWANRHMDKTGHIWKI
jgi:hypothetical protein